MYRFLLKPRWIAFHVLVLALMVTMVNLGFWQLRRLDERRAANREVSTRTAAAVASTGELPADPKGVFAGDAMALPEAENDWRFLRFRPPIMAPGAGAPHIRLDRALQFLIGDKLA